MIAEVALASILLVAGGLLIRSFVEVTEVDLGFEPEGAIVWKLNPTLDFESNADIVAFARRLTDRVGDLGAVESVGLTDAVPLGRNRSWGGFRIVGRETEDPINFFTHVTDPGYFRAMGIEPVAGRVYTPSDGPEAPGALVINETIAEERFGSAEAAVGQWLTSNWSGDWRIVGVVEDVLHVSPEAGPGDQFYFPIAQQPDYPGLEMVVRTSRPADQVVAAVAEVVAELDPGMPMQEYFTLDARVDRAVSARRFLLQILMAFGVSSLLLAGLGIYGVLAYSVAERRSEIGIRMALGATSGRMVQSIFKRTMALTAMGIGLGIVGSLLATRLLQSLLFGVSPGDPTAFAVMIGTLVAVAAAAGYLPALRASRLSGIRALRSE